jgi:hypothetical protein
VAKIESESNDIIGPHSNTIRIDMLVNDFTIFYVSEFFLRASMGSNPSRVFFVSLES